MKSSVKTFPKIVVKSVHRELRNATFEGEKHKPKFEFRALNMSHSVILGWAAEHFESDSRNLAEMFSRNRVNVWQRNEC